MPDMLNIQKQAVETILAILPEGLNEFEGSEYPLPIAATFVDVPQEYISEVRGKLNKLKDKDLKELLEPLLIASELFEASCSDKQEYFITDHSAQSRVFTGSKWKAGWVLVLGGDGREKIHAIISRLIEKNFMVFTDVPDIADTVYIGDRETSPVYFLQLMVRYGLIWGRIAPGNDHEMGHFLERDMPGFMIIADDLPPLKYCVSMGIMKLGAPAVVPSSFPFPYGNRVTADSVEDIITRGSGFPNLRVRCYRDETISLPDFCNPAFANEVIEEKRMYGGGRSFLCLRPASGVDRYVDVLGPLSDETREIGIIIDIEHERLSEDLALLLEQTALKSIRYISGTNAYEDNGVFVLENRAGESLDTDKLGEAMYWGLRLKYPRLKNIGIRFILEPETLAKESAQVREYKERRRGIVENMNEDTTDEFCFCTECRPFSLEHTCILIPGRIPMCASRTYFTVKAETYFGLSAAPYQRTAEREIPLKQVFQKGRALDTRRGEYEGCNAAYRETTREKLTRVYLHSIRDFPLTSCGCFQNLAFWISEVDGIGIMSRNSDAVTPEGNTWAKLANRAGGKQSPGISGVSLAYIRSVNFLKGDGGIENVVWVDSKLYEKLAGCFSPGQRVATEQDVHSIEGLKKYLGSMSGSVPPSR